MSTTPVRNEPRVGWSPARRSAWYHFEFYRQTWRGSVISNFLFPILYLGSMGMGVGHLVNAHAGLVEGHPYLDFVAPGLLAMTTMQVGSGESMWPILGGLKWTRNYHAAIATPLTPDDVLAGKVLFVAARMFFTGVVYLGVMLAFGVVTSWWALLLPFVGVLVGLAFTTPLIAFSSTLESDAPFALVQRFLLTPMFLFSATFYPISQYPAALRPVVQIMPLYHGVELSRSAAFGSGVWTAMLAHCLVLVMLTVAGWWWARRNFRRRLVL